MCGFVENFRGLLEPEFGIGVANGHDVSGHHQHLLNFSRADDIMSQFAHKLQPARAEHVVR